MSRILDGSLGGASLTPLMRQYWEIKSLHPDKILLFRMGDFFEMFFEDAMKAAPLLGIALTSRNKKAQDETPMCGVPHHSIGGPINKLLSQGLRVAICDQIEDPKLAKGIVKRAVTRILTPGMVYDPESLERTQPNYIASFDESTVSFVDTSTGESFYFPLVEGGNLEDLLEVLPVVELVLDPGENLGSMENLEGRSGVLVTRFQSTQDYKCTPMEDVFPAFSSLPLSARRLVSYVRSLSGEEGIRLLRPFESRSRAGRMSLSPTLLKHLEIFQTYSGEREGSLFHTIDRTKTAAGARLLRSWILFPLVQAQEIEKRWDKVTTWTQNLEWLKMVRLQLSKMGDLERLLSKLSRPQVNARDLLALIHSIELAQEALELSGSLHESGGQKQGSENPNEDKMEEEGLLKVSSLCERGRQILVDDPPAYTRQGHMIRHGVDPQLDEWMDLTTDTQGLLQKMEEEERAKTQISSLKIRYNSVFGYYIEVTHTHREKVPPHYKRKQTLTNAERYVTDELEALEQKILVAQSERFEMEFQVFDSLRREFLGLSPLLLKLADQVAHLDVYSSFAWLSVASNYIRPTISSDGSLRLIHSRHPVVEVGLRKEKSVSFVSNSLEMEASSVLLLTGPNMAGKSTLMRQVGLAAILAQVGSFVPATQASLPLFDQIFTRIGASDQLSEGLSTFMVEMREVAQMLGKATSRSLLILDEVGRGTSTFDGMSLAQSILEYLLQRVGALTLFATHYHELTELESQFPSFLKNGHMGVVEKDGEIRFLYTLTKGAAMKSYGIQVARLAGLPSEITERAREILSSRSEDVL